MDTCMQHRHVNDPGHPAIFVQQTRHVSLHIIDTRTASNHRMPAAFAGVYMPVHTRVEVRWGRSKRETISEGRGIEMALRLPKNFVSTSSCETTWCSLLQKSIPFKHCNMCVRLEIIESLCVWRTQEFPDVRSRKIDPTLAKLLGSKCILPMFSVSLRLSHFLSLSFSRSLSLSASLSFSFTLSLSPAPTLACSRALPSVIFSRVALKPISRPSLSRHEFFCRK